MVFASNIADERERSSKVPAHAKARITIQDRHRQALGTLPPRLLIRTSTGNNRTIGTDRYQARLSLILSKAETHQETLINTLDQSTKLTNTEPCHHAQPLSCFDLASV